MFTITPEFLAAFPNWSTAQGWQVGDSFNLTTYLTSLSQSAQDNINAHPPHKPGH